MGYTKNVITGISWTWALTLSTRVISFLSIILLARILNPSQFGIYGIAMLVMALLEVLTETGVNVILIQEKGKIEAILDSAWVVSIIRGIVIAALMLVLSPFVALFFNSPSSLTALLLLAIVPFLRGFINPSEIRFQKELNFKKEFLYRLIILVFGTSISISLALITHSVNSLILGLIAGVILQVLLSFLFISPRPRFVIDRKYFSGILNNGKWITLSGIFNYLFHNFDNIVVGRLLGTGGLGLYEMAYNISMLPITDVSDVISKVTFPVYAVISDDTRRLRKAFLKTLLFVSMVSIPFGIILIVFPYEIVKLVLGQKWLGIVDVLRILVLFGVIRAISGSSSALFMSLKKQKYVTVITLVSILSLAVTIVPLVMKYGISGAGISALIGSLAALPFILYFTIKVLR
jgi:O-antigen/teichoic acid export membrane protein